MVDTRIQNILAQVRVGVANHDCRCQNSDLQIIDVMLLIGTTGTTSEQEVRTIHRLHINRLPVDHGIASELDRRKTSSDPDFYVRPFLIIPQVKEFAIILLEPFLTPSPNPIKLLGNQQISTIEDVNGGSFRSTIVPRVKAEPQRCVGITLFTNRSGHTRTETQAEPVRGPVGAFSDKRPKSNLKVGESCPTCEISNRKPTQLAA